MHRLGVVAGLLLTTIVGCAGSADGTVTGPDQEVVSGGDGENAASPGAAAPIKPRAVKVIANVGDSMSQAMDVDDSAPVDIDQLTKDANKVFFDHPDLSWIQGTDVRVSSVFQHYKALDASVTITPMSHSGAELVGELQDRPNFVEQTTALIAKNAHPDLVYSLLGGNDVCNRAKSDTADATKNMYPVSEWVEHIDQGLTILANGLDAGATVKVLSMPRVDRLYENAGDARFTAKYSFINTSLSCKQFWSLTSMMGQGFCQIITTEGDASRRAAVGERIDEYNDALAAEVHRFNTDRTLNPKGVFFLSDWHGALGKGGTENGSMGTFAFDADLVSKHDCFHPSVKGQAAIANLVLNTADWE